MDRRATLWVVAVFGSLVIGCGEGAGVRTDFSDRQIFDGVMFGAGPVGNLLPEARDHLSPELYARSPDELSAMGDARAAIIGAIENAHPGFLAEFARAARSGDPARVEAMIRLAEGRISKTAPGVTSTNLPLAKSANLPTATSTNLPTATSTNLPTATSTNLPTATSTNLPTATSTNLPATTSTNLPGTSSTNLPLGESLKMSTAGAGSSLFIEQLANSVAITFGQSAGGR